METIARPGFFTSLISYDVFFLLELVRAGFVSRAFSVHLFLLIAILFAFWWMAFSPKPRIRPVFFWTAAGLFALLAGMLTWNFTSTLGDMRGLLSALAFLAVINLVRLVKQL